MHTGFWQEKPVGKRVLVRPRHRWENNIKIDAMEIGLHHVDQICLAEDWDK